MLLKLGTTIVMLTLLVEQCCLQEVPGLAYMDILRTAPRKRIEGASADPALTAIHFQPNSNRRYDVMLEYDYDIYEENSSEEQEPPVVTTLERPQKSETLLSTDITDYVLISVDSAEDPDFTELPSLALAEGQGFLPTDSFISRSSIDNFQIPSAVTGQRMQQQESRESIRYVTALRAPSYSEEEFIFERKSTNPQKSNASPINFRIPFNDYSEEGYDAVSSYPSGSYPTNSYSGDHAISFMSEDDPSSTDYYLPRTAYQSDDLESDIYLSENQSFENRTHISDFSDYLATSSQNYPSYNPNYYPVRPYNSRERTRDYYYATTSKPKNYKAKLKHSRPYYKSNPASPSFATVASSAKHHTPLDRQSNVSPNNRNPPAQSRVNRQNREEIMYYTGLQKEIEKSSLLSEAIKDVRSREGKTITNVNKDLRTTTITPPPDIRSIRDTLGAHPLYKNLPGMLSSSEIKSKSFDHREYKDENDEYENMYLPARAKSLELTEIDEVKEYFNTLVPTASYKPRDFPKYPSSPGQGIHLPPITTYKPSEFSKYSKILKPLTLSPSMVYTKSPAMMPLEHRSITKSPSKLYTKSPAMMPLEHRSITKNPSNLSSNKVSSTQHHYPPGTHVRTPKPYTSSSTSKLYRPILAQSPKIPSRYRIPSQHSSHRPTTLRPYNKKPKYVNYIPTTPTSYYKPPTKAQFTSLVTIKPNTRQNSRQPTSDLFREAGAYHYHPTLEESVRQKGGPTLELNRDADAGRTLYRSKLEESARQKKGPTMELNRDADAGRIHYRPKQEESVRQKRGPNMELSIDSNVQFPKFGYNIDRYFEDFPGFGFFDYNPSKEVHGG